MNLTKAIIIGLFFGLLQVSFSPFYGIYDIPTILFSCIVVGIISYYYFRSFKLGAVFGIIVAIIPYIFQYIIYAKYYYDFMDFSLSFLYFLSEPRFVSHLLSGAIGGYLSQKKLNIKSKPEVSSLATVTCPSCGSEIPKNAKFCPKCGAPMTISCPNCGAMIYAGSKFCPKCGKKVNFHK